jgi:hypothetical protein
VEKLQNNLSIIEDLLTKMAKYFDGRNFSHKGEAKANKTIKNNKFLRSILIIFTTSK